MVAIGETITVVNKSGKVVSTSKHLVNVFNEAKSAYNERKAELKAKRAVGKGSKTDERKARKQLKALTVDDGERSSVASSRRGSEDGRSIRRKPVAEQQRSSERPPVQRGVSASFYETDSSLQEGRRHSARPSPLGQDSGRGPRSGELTRRYTDGLDIEKNSNSRRCSRHERSVSMDDIDMDLAYGELPPPLPVRKLDDESELRQKMSALQVLLDECNCFQHSVKAIIDNLQENPDALAAVALTLAEISNLASKMAPGALMSMKGAFPAVIALLASPEFAIAAGVGIGVTIIAFGGYKIIKKIKTRKQGESGLLVEGDGSRAEPGIPESEMDSLREMGRVERWRRGIEFDTASVETSVDGEFLTPQATKTLIQQGKLTEADLKTKTDSEDTKSKKMKHRSSRKSKSGKDELEAKSKAKKEPSGLRMLIKGNSST